jgi:hypothetical protein
VFGELPKLFDRNFAIAYFLPSAAFVGVSYCIGRTLDLLPVMFKFSADTLLKDIAAFGLLSLFGGIVLLIANRGIVRLLEGYWPKPFHNRLKRFEVSRFRKMIHRIGELDQEMEGYELLHQTVPAKLSNEWDELKKEQATRFPNEERLVLPTAFGNIFRAFEVYPRVMYGINAIPGWYRLLAVVPKDYCALIDAARVYVDFWVNLCALSLLVLAEFYIAAIAAHRISISALLSRSGHFPWIPVLALVTFLTSYRLAQKAAREWGNWVKATFDIYLPKLRACLEYAPSVSAKEEYEKWVAFNVAVLTRDPRWMPQKIRTNRT